MPEATLEHSVIDWVADMTAPRIVTDIIEWAQGTIVVPRSINPDRPGPLSWDGYEPATDILRAIADPTIRQVMICAPPQFLKTFLITVGMLYVADQLGGPQLYVTSTSTKQDEFVSQKLKPLIEASPTLAAKVLRDGLGNYDGRYYKNDLVRLAGDDIYLGAAGSPASLASTTAWVAWGDEPAKWRQKFAREGGAVTLLKKRVDAFPETGKVVLVSTPPQILDEENDFWVEFTSGSLERCFLPCPHCGGFHPMGINEKEAEGDPLRFFSLHHHAEKRDGAEDYDLARVEATGYLKCPDCGNEIGDRFKPEMIRSYQWRATNENPDPGKRTFWLNRLYQPGVRFGRFLSNWFIANRREKDLMDFLLQEMAQPYKPNLSRVEIKAFRHLVHDDESYTMGNLPANHTAAVLGIFADVQEIELPWTLWAMAGDTEAWLVEYGDAYELEELKQIADNAAKRLGLPLHGGIVDAGHRTREVYQFCFDNPQFIPAHGRDSAKLLHWTKELDVDRGLKRNVRKPREIKCILWQNMGWKTEFYQGIVNREEGKGRRRVIHLPHDTGKHPKLLRQLSAEKLVKSKYGKMRWEAFRANHYGDTALEMLVYCELFRGRLAPERKINLPPPTTAVWTR